MGWATHCDAGVGGKIGWNVYDGQDHQSTYDLFYDRIVVPTAAASQTIDNDDG